MNKRKNVFTVFLLFAASLANNFADAQTFSGDTWAKSKAAGSGTISFAYVETPAFVYADNAGNLTGICVDIMNDFVKYVAANKKVVLKSKFVGEGTSFSGMYASVKASSKGVFGLGNITITPERKKEVLFSQSFITNFAVLITHKDIATLARFEDLPTTFANLTAYATKGTLNEKRILELKAKYYPAMKIEATATSHETLDKIVKDTQGFAYLDLAFYLQGMRQQSSLKRHPIGDQKSEQFGIIMPKDSDWQPIMDEFFKANGGYTNSKEYKEILVKHLGATGLKLLQMSK